MNYNIAVYGLTEEQVSLLEAALPEGYEPVIAECVTDLIVMDNVCSIMDASKLNNNGRLALTAYALDAGDRMEQTMVWLGGVESPDLPGIVCFDSFLELLMELLCILEQAQLRYDTLHQYTGVYSHLPRHAVAECLEADYYAALKRWLPNYPLKEAGRLWTKVLELKNGSELLASVCELCRWLKREGIPYRLKHGPRWNIFVLLFFLSEEGICIKTKNGFVFYINQSDLPRVECWLREHWYFRTPDKRLQLQGIEHGAAP